MKQNLKVHFYNLFDLWGWELSHAGRVIAASGQSYTRYRDCKRTFVKMMRYLEADHVTITKDEGY